VQRERWAKGTHGFSKDAPAAANGRRIADTLARAFRCRLDAPGAEQALVLSYIVAMASICMLARWYGPRSGDGLDSVGALAIIVLHALFWARTPPLGSHHGPPQAPAGYAAVVASLMWIAIRGLRGAEGLLWEPDSSPT